MQLHCPQCGSAIPADDVDLSTALAKCRRCDTVFSFRDAIPATGRRPPEGAPGVAAAANLPPITPLLSKSRRFRIDEFAGVLRIRYRWFSPVFIFLAFFCVVWDGFLVVWYTAALGDVRGGIGIAMALFPMLHVAVGVGLTYLTISGFLNSTTIDVGQGQITIRHHPLPWAGNRTLRADQILQLHCEEKRTRHENGNSYAYALFATLTTGQKLRLLGGFTDPAEPRELEARIEGHLKIPQRPVVGEYRG